VSAGVEHDAAPELIAKSFRKNAEAAEVPIVDICTGPDLDAHDRAIATFQEQIDFVAGYGAKVE
jgi:hypothetical protein